jgi:hypothetical protein
MVHGLNRLRPSRFRAPEALFQPSFLGLEAAGIHETTYVDFFLINIVQNLLRLTLPL